MKKKILLSVALATSRFLPALAYRDSADMDDGNGSGFLYFLGLMVIIGIIGTILKK